jgi:hypothetical protein
MFSAITSSPCFDTSLRSPIISIQRDGTACRAAHCSLTSLAGACTRSHPLLTHRHFDLACRLLSGDGWVLGKARVIFQ